MIFTMGDTIIDQFVFGNKEIQVCLMATEHMALFMSTEDKYYVAVNYMDYEYSQDEWDLKRV